MKTFESQFHNEAQHIRVTPSHGTWDRIRARIDAQRSKRRFVTMRLLGIAAVVLLLIGSAAVFYSLSLIHDNHSGAHQMTITELNVTPVQGESIYDVSRVRRSYADLSVSR